MKLRRFMCILVVIITCLAIVSCDTECTEHIDDDLDGICDSCEVEMPDDPDDPENPDAPEDAKDDKSELEEALADYHYTVDGTNYVITGLKNQKLTRLVIPDGVHSIAECAFESNQTITEVVFEGNTLKLIDEFAFRACKNLQSVTLPESLYEIGTGAFRNNKSLKTVKIEGNALEIIGYSAFYECDLLSEINVPDSVKVIDTYSFAYCSSLEKIPLAETSELETIGEKAFLYAGLTELFIPGKVKTMGEEAFLGNRIETLRIAEGVTSIGDRVFQLAYVKNLNLPTTLRSIGIFAFENCQMTELMLPEGLEIISSHAFQGCELITKLSLPSTLSEVRGLPFDTGDLEFLEFNCKDLKTDIVVGIPSIEVLKIGKSCENVSPIRTLPIKAAEVCSESEHYKIVDGAVYSKNGEAIHIFPSLRTDTEYTVPEGVKEIKSFCFYGESVAKINLPSSISKIGAFAFKKFEIKVTVPSLTDWLEITFDRGPCQHTGFYLYVNGEPLTTLEIPDGVERIGDFAFGSLRGLESVTIPASVTNIGQDAFKWAADLKYVVSAAPVLGENMFYHCGNMDSVTLSGAITKIPDGCFYDDNITNITIPPSVTEIAHSAFEGATLSSVHISDIASWCEIIRYRNHAGEIKLFIDGTQVTEVVVPESVTEIAAYAFSNVLGIKKLTLHDKIEKIGSYAFLGRNTFEKLYIPDVETWCKVEIDNPFGSPTMFSEKIYFDGVEIVDLVIPESVTEIHSHLFMGIQSIRTVTIHNNVRSIGIYAFFYCQSLETVTLPTGIEKIDLYTFSQCTALKTITLPASVKIISQYAFAECTSLVSVIVSDDGEGWRYTERPGDTKDIAIDKQTILDPAKFAEMLSSKNKKSYFWKEA